LIDMEKVSGQYGKNSRVTFSWGNQKRENPEPRMNPGRFDTWQFVISGLRQGATIYDNNHGAARGA